MKRNTVFPCTTLLICLLCCSTIKMPGQGKVSLSAGIGFPELINGSIKYQAFPQIRIGLSVGWFPPSQPGWFSWENLFAFTGDCYFHVAGSSKYSDLYPWYLRVGANLLIEVPTDYVLFYEDLFLRAGRDIYLDENSGISLDAGVGFNFYGANNFFLAMGVCYFYRF